MICCKIVYKWRKEKFIRDFLFLCNSQTVRNIYLAKNVSFKWLNDADTFLPFGHSTLSNWIVWLNFLNFWSVPSQIKLFLLKHWLLFDKVLQLKSISCVQLHKSQMSHCIRLFATKNKIIKKIICFLTLIEQNTLCCCI